MVMQAILIGGPLDGMNLTVHAEDATLAIPTTTEIRELLGSQWTPEIQVKWSTAIEHAGISAECLVVYSLEEKETEAVAESRGWFGIPRLFYRYAKTDRKA